MSETMKMIGRVLSANSAECVVSYCVGENEIPPFGSMLRIPLTNGTEIYGIVTDVTMEEDGFLRKIAASPEIPEEVLLDNQQNRNVPIVLRLHFLGYRVDDRILHLLPPNPPMTLASIYACTDREVTLFTRKLGYLRLLLNVTNIPVSELISVHIHYASRSHAACEDAEWTREAVDEIIDLLRDDYDTLTKVLCTIADADISF